MNQYPINIQHLVLIPKFVRVGDIIQSKWQQNLYIPQAGLAGHDFGAGLVPATQFESAPAEHLTLPGVPDAPAFVPHLYEQPVGSSRIQFPGSVHDQREK